MGLAQRPISPKVKDMVIGPGKPKGFSKKPMSVKKVRKNEMGRGCPKNKMGPRCSKNEMGQGCPRNEMDRGSPRHRMSWPSRNVGQKSPKE